MFEWILNTQPKVVLKSHLLFQHYVNRGIPATESSRFDSKLWLGEFC